MRRGTVRREVQIAVPAATAWSVVGRPELLHLWFPGIAACTVDGDQRSVTTDAGLTLQEAILTNDPLQRRFQYSLTGGFFAEHLATVDAVELGPDRCLVTYATDCRPAVMAIVLGGAAEGALRALRDQLEAGTGPALDAVTAGVAPDLVLEA
jgi:carbon monoxide dehydrogenase subunit G